MTLFYVSLIFNFNQVYSSLKINFSFLLFVIWNVDVCSWIFFANTDVIIVISVEADYATIEDVVDNSDITVDNSEINYNDDYCSAAALDYEGRRSVKEKSRPSSIESNDSDYYR